MNNIASQVPQFLVNFQPQLQCLQVTQCLSCLRLKMYSRERVMPLKGLADGLMVFVVEMRRGADLA